MNRHNYVRLFGLLLVWIPLLAYAAPAAGPTVLVSRSGGTPANGASYAPDISADGRFVVFSSEASNLVPFDTNNARDIFAADLELGTIRRVSIRSDGGQTFGDSFAPAISADGRLVVFYTLGSNLGNDNPGVADVYAHDLQTGQTTLISRATGGAANGSSYDPDLSADGRYVVFWSSASNLVDGDANGRDDVFRYDRQTGSMVRVSVDSNGQEGNDHSHHATISGDGQRVAFVSAASNLVPGDGNNYQDIFVRDIGGGSTERVSVSTAEAEANGGSWDYGAGYWTPDISGNGRYVAFVSLATNLVSGDTNSYPDIFVRDLQSGETTRANLATGGAQANGWSEGPTIAADGRYVAFQSVASTLAGGNIASSQDIFVRDRQTGTLVRTSVDSDGDMADKTSMAGVVAGDGRYVTFASFATNLAPGDGNGVQDIFRHDMEEPIPPPLLTVNYNSGAPGSVFTFTGTHFALNTPAQLTVNGVSLGSVNPDGSGTITFQLISQISDQEGWYGVQLVQGDLQAATAFALDSAAPVRSGSGGGYNLPVGVAYTEVIYLPQMLQR